MYSGLCFKGTGYHGVTTAVGSMDPQLAKSNT